MASLSKYWFRFLAAPHNILEKVRLLKEQHGYSPRTNSNGEPIMSELFLMHWDAATVRKASVLDNARISPSFKKA